MEEKWWHNKVIYQIYPRSFMDSNGDGIGDLEGIRNKLDYLEELGVGIIWLCPVYTSPNKDNGYDISDYYGIMEEFGTMGDMYALIQDCKSHNISIMMDLVLNHSLISTGGFCSQNLQEKILIMIIISGRKRKTEKNQQMSRLFLEGVSGSGMNRQKNIIYIVSAQNSRI